MDTPCDVCEAEPTAFIVGNADTGEQQYLGPSCMARFGLEIAKALLPAEEIAQALGPMFVQPSEKPATGDGGRKRGKGRGDAPEAATAAQEPQEGPAEESAAAQE